ncbi:hypothetical protein [Weizmannia acidilactici]|nr:hypothetical protein [Weizmannia acidilactici]
MKSRKAANRDLDQILNIVRDTAMREKTTSSEMEPDRKKSVLKQTSKTVRYMGRKTKKEKQPVRSRLTKMSQMFTANPLEKPFTFHRFVVDVHERNKGSLNS